MFPNGIFALVPVSGRLMHVAFIAFLGLGIQASIAGAQESPGSQKLAGLVATANLIFEGTVVGPGFRDGTVETHVDAALLTPNALTSLNGSSVLLIPGELGPPEPRQRFVFFTRTTMIGAVITAEEVDRIPIEASQELRSLLAGAEQRLDDARLQERLAAADLVVVGRITSIEPVELDPQAPVSEHDPQWQRATIEVSEVIAGSTDAREVTLIYPGTMDVAFVGMPRPSPGQDAVWLLTPSPDLGGYTALDPLDMQPAPEVGRIQRLLEAPN